MKFTCEQIKDFLCQHLQSKINDVSMLSGGDWSQAFSFRYAGENYVIRFGMHQEDYISDQMASKFTSDVLPIPEVIEIGKALGFFYPQDERKLALLRPRSISLVLNSSFLLHCPYS